MEKILCLVGGNSTDLSSSSEISSVLAAGRVSSPTVRRYICLHVTWPGLTPAQLALHLC